ncbi:MAG: GAF domain-containing protein [Gemmatimonadales bacterium]|nr:GAF domain-containing protein [Gemmatimonadales bacterium]
MKGDSPPPGPGPTPWQTQIAARVPLLRLDGAGWDVVALETWREALSSMLGTEVPHDLLGLWLYPHHDSAVLLGPPELAQDDLQLPRPTPHLDDDQLRQVEHVVRHAGYGSAICVSIPHGGRAVGVMLVANLRHGEYGSPEAIFLRQAAGELGPIMARIARQWIETKDEATGVPRPLRDRGPGREAHAREIHGLLDTLGAAMRDATTPRQLTQLLGAAVEHVLPHDAIELLVPDEAAEQHYRLSGHVHGHLWSHPTMVVSRAEFSPGRLFEESDELLVSDAASDRRAPVWGFPHQLGADAEIRSVIGVRLRGTGGSRLGYLLLGNIGPEFYWEEDADLLARVGAAVAPRLESVVLAWELDVLQSHLGVLRSVPAHLGRIAEILATTAHVSVATRLVAQEAAAVLPFSQCEFAIRLGSEEEVVVFEPGETQPLSKLPVMRYTGTELGRVLDGELGNAFAEARHKDGDAPDGTVQPTAALVVPVRVGGRVFGTMTLVATGGQSFTRADISLAQQLADVLAPHLELLRQGALPTRPSGQAWRRITRPEQNRPV